MVLRPSRGFVPVCVGMIVLMGTMSFGLFGYALVAEPRLVTLTGGLALAIVPFWLEFVRSVLHVAGSLLELDERGATWVRGGQSKRIEWDAVLSVSHGWMDRTVWEFRDAHGGVLALFPGWYDDPAALGAAMRGAIEGYVGRLPFPEQVVLHPSHMDRSMVVVALGTYVAFVLTMIQGLATIPREFFPHPAYALAWTFVVAATLFTAMGIAASFRNRTVIDGERIVCRIGVRTRTIPLPSIREARHTVWTREDFPLPIWRTTLTTDGKPLELSSRDEGYFEAVRLIDAFAPSIREARAVSRAEAR